ncbi:hypothetical protein RB597_008376 [Gaeumannomyces tritici]
MDTRKTMNDDTRSDRPQPAFEAKDVEKMKKLWNFKMSRTRADIWALRDMVFLVYDDTEEKEYGYDSDDDEGMLDAALKMSVEADGSAEAGPSAKPAAPTPPPEFCACGQFPEFPSNRKTRKFKLVQLPPKRPVCPHYIAVSYCWPPLKEEAAPVPERTYRVRDLDGTTRTARALDDVLDRAVDFANTALLRMIWIDQECLPQPTDESPQKDHDYHHTGVQAMDIVYEKAMITAGLHDGVVVSQQELDTIHVFQRLAGGGGGGTARSAQPHPSQVLQMFKFLVAVVQDRWYTRAWVAQEALSASHGLWLVFRKAPGVTGNELSLRKANNHGQPPHSLEMRPRAMPSENVCISRDDLRGLVRVTRAFFESRQLTWQLHFFLSNAMKILDRAEALHPSSSDMTKNPHGGVHVLGSGEYGKGQAVSASTALTILKNRDCRDTQDRIAIMANMCRYEVRIHAGDAASHCDSLRAGVLSLALLNSDLSLLVPEMYKCSTDSYDSLCRNPSCCCNGLDSGLFSPFDTHPGFICDLDQYHVSRVMPTVYKHSLRNDPTKPGVQLSAYTWTVDREIDLSLIRYQYLEKWQQLLNLTLTPLQRDATARGPSESEVQQSLLVTERFTDPTDPEFQSKVKEEVIRNGGVLPPDSPLWGDLNPEGVKFSVQLSATYVEGTAENRACLAEIIFGLLRYLSVLDDPQAQGLADSIWQSVRAAATSSSADRPLPDTVSEGLFSHPDVQAVPFETLQLDVDKRWGKSGGYHQLWFLERIMEKGTLWVGSYRRAHPENSELDLGASIPDSPAAASGDDPQLQSGNPTKSPVKGLQGKTILEKQLTTKILMHMLKPSILNSLLEKEEAGGDGSDLSASVDISSMVSLCQAIVGETAIADMDPARDAEMSRRLVSAFDVDGPCVVATPYDASMEVLPRPPVRSMSTCWVVEELPALGVEDTLAEGGRQEGPDGGGSSSGHARHEQDEGEQKERPTARMEILTRRYKVVRKVRGVRQIMEQPAQEHVFL